MTTATPTPLSLSRPTAPLPPAAAAALSRLERAFPPAEVVRAVTRFEVALGRKSELEAKPTRSWAVTEYDSWVDCDRVLVESATVLATAGRLDLIETILDPVVRAAVDFRKAAVHAAALATQAVSPDGPPLSDLDADSLAHAEDLMAGARAVLAEAGQLDLIGGGR